MVITFILVSISILCIIGGGLMIILVEDTKKTAILIQVSFLIAYLFLLLGFIANATK